MRRRKVIDALALLVAVAVLAVLVGNPEVRDGFRAGIGDLYGYVAGRCRSPIQYRIGEIDSRFGTGEAAVLAAAREAEALWEAAAGRELFEYSTSTDASLTIELVYDDRQANTTAFERYEDAVAAHNALVAVYEAKLEAYNERVDEWNDNPGSRRERSALERDGEALRREASELEASGAALNDQADQLNGWSETHEAFQSAVFNGSNLITVYDFANAYELKLQLAHEMGHALGMDHVDEESAVMYYLLNPDDPKPFALAAADVAALRAVCDLEK
jgi:hypothetical protein